MMGRWPHRCAALLVSVCLVACAGVGVPYTSDPYEKLKWAGGLVHQGARPLPAEGLIREALRSFEARGDELGLAAAYRVYGGFFSSPTIAKPFWREYYGRHRFLDTTATYDGRYLKSIEYYEKAAMIYERHSRSDWLTYVYLNTGLAYTQIGDTRSACRAFQLSEAKYRATTTFSTEINIAADFPKLLASSSESANCR